MILLRWFVLLLVAIPMLARAETEQLSGDEVVRRVDARDDGQSASRTLVMELVEKDGTQRSRVTRSFRRDFADGRRLALFFEDPPNLKGTALLTFDYADPRRTDDQWLYLPELRKSRRIATSERGRAFLGTDLSYEDMKKETKLSPDDYRWTTLGEEVVDGRRCWVVEGAPADAETARDLGYGRVRVRVDAELWIPRFAEYWSPSGDPLKTIHLSEIERIQGIWTPQRIEAVSLVTGHRTALQFRDVEYQQEVPEAVFSESSLAHGAPGSGGAQTR